MNYPILWWTAPRSRAAQLNRIQTNFSSRLARAALAAATAIAVGPLAAVPVRAEDPPVQPAPAAKAPAAPQLQVDATPLQRTTGAVTSYAPIVDKVGPSIVTIVITREGGREQSNPFDGNPALRRFFGMPENPGPDEDGGGRDSVEGSGVIVSPDGLILTNNHVAEAGNDIVVRIGDRGREYKAKVVGSDPSSDLALIRIDAKDLPVITFADSDQVKVGDVVLAVGSPFGFTNTVTMGIVSGLGRVGIEENEHGYENFIQTDAPINPGNSGGALVDTEGRLIGINTAIYSRSGGYQGIGFAVPSDMARNVIDSLLKNGRVSRGFLGTGVQTLSPDLAEQFNLPDDQQGALITSVNPGSAAEKAGLQNGDVITAVNGKTITSPQTLRLTVGGMSPGDKVTVQYIRNGKSTTADVTLGSENPAADLADNTTKPDDHPNVLDGIGIGDLDPAARADLKVPGSVKGVLVTDVAPDSAAAEAGLHRGDVIIEMNHQPMTSAQEAIDDSTKIGLNDKVLLHVWTNGMTQYVVLKPKAA